jgi:hypothetical protein
MNAELSSADDREPTVIPLVALEQGAHALLAWLPSDVLGRLAKYTAKHVIRQKRLDERDELVRRFAAEYFGDLPSGRAMADEIHRALSRYAAGADAKRNEPPADPRRSSLHRMLRLSLGRVPSGDTLRGVLAGLTGVKKNRKSATRECTKSTTPLDGQ